MWYLTMMVKGVGTNGIFVVLLRFALVTVPWSVAPNSVVFDVLPSAFKQNSSLLWFKGFVSAATLDAMLYAVTGGPASRRFCPVLGFATAWFAFDFIGAATIISCCFQPAFVTEMIFDRSLQNWVSGHEIVLLFLVSVMGTMWFLVPGRVTLQILAVFVLCSLVSGGLVKDKESGKGICFSRKWFVDTVASQALTAACLAATILDFFFTAPHHTLDKPSVSVLTAFTSAKELFLFGHHPWSLVRGHLCPVQNSLVWICCAIQETDCGHTVLRTTTTQHTTA